MLLLILILFSGSLFSFDQLQQIKNEIIELEVARRNAAHDLPQYNLLSAQQLQKIRSLPNTPSEKEPLLTHQQLMFAIRMLSSEGLSILVQMNSPQSSLINQMQNLTIAEQK